MKKIVSLILCMLLLSGTTAPVLAVTDGKTAQKAQKTQKNKTTKTNAIIAFVIDGPSPANSYFLENSRNQLRNLSQKITMLFIRRIWNLQATGRKQVQKRFVIRHLHQMLPSLLHWVT